MIAQERKQAVVELAQILGISPDLISKALRMLEAKTAYRVWTIPKKPEGTRQIQEALEPLNGIQTRIAQLVYHFTISEISHGFIGGRSNRTAIRPHLKANAFFSFDIKNAFPSTKKQQVQFAFQKVDFKPEIAALMAHLVCYSPTNNTKEGHIPLGYTSSPILFNLLLRDIDRLLFDFAQKRDYEVSRYVDNFALSTTKQSIPPADRKLAVKIVEGFSVGQFKIPPEKTAYVEAKAEVCFEFLGLTIKGLRGGERRIEVADEKLGECLFAILEALEKSDFSEGTSRHIQGQINYLRSVYKARPLPPHISEVYEQYKFMKQLADSAKQGQLLLPMPPFQT